MNNKRIDLTDMKFGMLTAIEPAPNIGKRTAWLCVCECGNYVTVSTDKLKCGYRTSCGCRRHRGIEDLHYIDGTCIEMLKNDKIRANCNSGHTGVSYDKTQKRWRADITFKGKRYYLGRFKTIEQACRVREDAKQKIHDKFIEGFMNGIHESDSSDCKTQSENRNIL